jgi:hypothetical protein
MPKIRCPGLVCFIALAAVSVSLYAQQPTLPLKPGSVRFAAIGDMGNGGKEQYTVAGQMVGCRSKFPFDFVLMLGDNLIGSKDPIDYQNKFELPYKPLLDAGVKFYAVFGNHDVSNERFYKLATFASLPWTAITWTRSSSRGWKSNCRTQTRIGKSAISITRSILPGPSMDLP